MYRVFTPHKSQKFNFIMIFLAVILKQKFHSFIFIFLFFLQFIGSPNVCYASEKSVVDPSEQTMTLRTINLTFCNFLSVYETLSYVPHPKDPAKTLLKQEATVQVEGIPLCRYMEDMLTNNISFNAGKGRQGLEWVISKINAEVNRNLFFKYFSVL